MAFFTDDWHLFVCSTDISIEIDGTKLPIRTRGDGHWKKYAYQDIQFIITLSGLLKFDDDNFTGWDLLNNQLGFSSVLVRCSFDDQNGNVRTVQGYVIIEKSNLTFAPGQLVKNDFSLQGNGKLDIFDGLIPCPSAITSITVDGVADEDGIVHASYTYSGDVYQVQYQIDGTGAYATALAGTTISIPGLSVGRHSINIIPVCTNGYQGTDLTVAFDVTQGMVCSSTISGMIINEPLTGMVTGPSSGITLNPGVSPISLQPAMTGGATQFIVAIDAFAETTWAAGSKVPITGLSVGAHTVIITPLCTFGVGQTVRGTPRTFTFTIALNPAQSVINWSCASPQSLNIYVNGVLVVSQTGAGSGSFVAPIGASIRSTVNNIALFAVRMLVVTDTTTSTVLFNHSQILLITYSFTATGDTYQINAS